MAQALQFKHLDEVEALKEKQALDLGRLEARTSMDNDIVAEQRREKEGEGFLKLFFEAVGINWFNRMGAAGY